MSLCLSFECGPVATNCYLVIRPSEQTAVLFDAPYGSAEPVFNALVEHRIPLTHVVLTHTHWDHTADCAEIALHTGAAVVVHQADAYRLSNPMDHTIWPLPFVIESVEPDVVLSGAGGDIRLGGEVYRWIHTPGHTEGGVCFIHDRDQAVYVGDTLFAGSVGRVDLPGGHGPTLIRSIQQSLFLCPPEYTIYPGHGPTSTIGTERQSNPFVGVENT